MAWTTPMTAVSRDVWTAAEFNTQVRGNLLETMPGKATTAGSYFATTGPHAIAERVAASAVVNTSATYSGAAYGDLSGSAGPSVTVTTGSEAIVWMASQMSSSAGVGTPEVTLTTTYAATASQTFGSDGTNRGSLTTMYQGQFDSTWGNQFSLAMFPYSDMRSDMSGASVVSCELFLANEHFYQNSGGVAVIGTHAQTALSGDHDYSQVTPDLSEDHWGKGEAAYHFISEEIAERIRDSDATGITLGKGPTSSKNYYGYFTGGTSPKLRITYTKAGSSGGYCKVSVAVSGASTIDASDANGIYFSGVDANNSNRWAVMQRITNLTPGSNTFTMKYAAGTGSATGTFQRRELIVMPL